MDLIRTMVGIMSAAWNSLSNITIDGVSFTSLILAIMLICILLGAFLGGKSNV